MTTIQAPQPAPTPKHTPGPWLYSHREGADGMYRTEVFSAEHGGIATCDWTPKHCGNGVTATYREANSRLIAAAPELLAALQAFMATDLSFGTASMAMLECMAAAETRSARLAKPVLAARLAIAKATGEPA